MIKDPSMKIKVNIEETVVEEFEVDVPKGIDPYDYISKQYYAGKIVLEPGECQFRQMEIHNLENDTWTEWQEF